MRVADDPTDGHHDSTTRGAPAVQRAGLHFHQPDLPALLRTPGRRGADHRSAHPRRLAPGHRTSYQRVFSRAPWSGVALGCVLARFLLRHFIPDGTVTLLGDTVNGHKGKHVHGKARHRDPVRSTHTYTTWRYGHRWVVLAVLVKFPFATRPWALPVLVDLYRSEEDNRKHNRPHRAPAQLMCRLLRLMLVRFPDRTFLFVGDSGYGTHAVARFCHRHRDRLSLVSKLHPTPTCSHHRRRIRATGALGSRANGYPSPGRSLRPRPS
jgi:hypothetical protein